MKSIIVPVMLVVLALGLRIWGIEFGLPYTYHYDEHFYVNTAAKLGAGVINNPPYAATGLSNILFLEYAGYFLVGIVLQFFSSAQAFEAAFRNDPTAFYLLGRTTSAVLGSITVFALYFLGVALAGRAVGTIAAAFLAVTFLHVRDSHYSVPDVGMGFFVIFAVSIAALGVKHRDRRYIYLASLVGGFAEAMKWTALPVAFSLAWAAFVIGHDGKTAYIAKRLQIIVLCSGLFITGFVLGSPQILVNPTPYLNECLGQYRAGLTGGFDAWQVDTLPGWLFYGKTMLYGVGPLLLALGFVGAMRRSVLAMKTGERMSILLLSFPLSYFLLIGSTQHYFARYALPLIPFIALFAAEMVVVTAAYMRTRSSQYGLAITVVIAAAAIAQPLAYSVQHDLLLTREDTREEAKRWIEDNIPSGSSIATDWPTHGPPLSTAARPRPNSSRTYALTEVGGTGLSDHPILWYREQGFDYLIATSYIYELSLVNKSKDMARREFYALLDKELKLVKEFRPYRVDYDPPFVFDELYGPIISLWERDRPGPTIKVYKVNGS
ncbi:MAG: ArnT family glycosyltransferase [Chloroflexota bacterium]|jgi:hypothetical protein